MASAGDVNGDGYDDILIGAWGFGNGTTYLIQGRASGWWPNTALANSDASFTGEASGDAAGYSVASAGDVNGDGYDDIVIGGYGASQGNGEAYLVLGKATGWALCTSLSGADASFIGETDGDGAGYSVAAGDFNGDGGSDILISACYNNEAAWQSGQTYVVFSDDPIVAPLPEMSTIILFGAGLLVLGWYVYSRQCRTRQIRKTV